MVSPNVFPGIKSIEEIAAEIWKFPVDQIYVKTRKREVVEGRMAVMLFRHEKMRMSEAKAAAVYGMNHGSVIHARRTIGNLVQTDKEFRAKYELFELTFKVV